MFMLYLSMLLLQRSAFAESRPSWVDHPPSSDENYKYYVGRASDASSEAAGFSQAIRDAYEVAIRENFGFSAQIEDQGYESEASLSQVKRISEKSSVVQLQEFENVESFHETTPSGRESVWVLFKYKKSAIEKEKQRLANLPDQKAEPVFSEVGEAIGETSVLEVSSMPPGAQVFIDGDRWGVTPIRLYGKLKEGEHDLELDHPSFEKVEEKLVIVPSTTIHISKVLKKAFGKIKIISDPDTAKVSINGKSMGETPTRWLRFPAGDKVLVELVHPDAERTIQEIEIKRGDEREINVTMVLKVDRKLALVAPSSYVPQITYSEPSHFWDRLSINDWNFGLGFGLHDQTFEGAQALAFGSIDLSLEKKFFGFIGIRGNISGDFSANGQTPGEIMEGWTRSLTGVGYLLHSDTSALYGFYEYGEISQSYGTSNNGQNTFTQTVDQTERGYGGGYQGWPSAGKTGWMLEMGSYQYSSTPLHQGVRTFSGRIGILFKF